MKLGLIKMRIALFLIPSIMALIGVAAAQLCTEEDHERSVLKI